MHLRGGAETERHSDIDSPRSDESWIERLGVIGGEEEHARQQRARDAPRRQLLRLKALVGKGEVLQHGFQTTALFTINVEHSVLACHMHEELQRVQKVCNMKCTGAPCHSQQ